MLIEKFRAHWISFTLLEEVMHTIGEEEESPVLNSCKLCELQ